METPQGPVHRLKKKGGEADNTRSVRVIAGSVSEEPEGEFISGECQPLSWGRGSSGEQEEWSGTSR